MKKDSYEKLDDWFINLYEESLFVRCFEYSAGLVSELTWYRLYANIDKKNWFIFLECWFSKVRLSEIIKNLENKWYSVRLIDKNGNINSSIWGNKLEKLGEKLKEIKTNLIRF